MMLYPFADVLEAMSEPLEDRTIRSLDLVINHLGALLCLTPTSSSRHLKIQSDLKLLRHRRCMLAANVLSLQSNFELDFTNFQALILQRKPHDQILVPCKRRRLQTHTPCFPIEIIFKILALLPAEFLHEVVRFVCKQWFHVIAEPLFVKSHCHLSSPTLLFQEPSQLHHFNYIEGHTQTGELKAKQIQLPFPARVLASFNGILLLEDLENPLLCCIHVMNPVTKQIISLPPVGGSEIYRSTGVAITSSGHYKVVHVFSVKDYEHVQMWAYTIGVDKYWRSIDVQGRNISSSAKQSLCLPPYFIAGIIYWPGRPTDSGIALDVNNETIYEFSVRVDFFEERRRPRYYLSMGTGLGVVKKEGYIWQLWELTDIKTNEWTLVAEIDMQPVSKRVERIFSPLMYRPLWPISFINGEIWFYGYVHGSLAETLVEKYPVVRYNLADGSIAFFLVEELKFTSLPSPKRREKSYTLLHSHVHTLLSPKNC